MVNVLCIIHQNHERSVAVLDHFRNFKGIYLIVDYNIENEEGMFIQGKGHFCSKLKKGKLKTNKLLKLLGILDEQQVWNCRNMYLPKHGKWPSQDLYLKINSGFHASSVKWRDPRHFLKSQGKFFCHFHVPFFYIFLTSKITDETLKRFLGCSILHYYQIRNI